MTVDFLLKYGGWLLIAHLVVLDAVFLILIYRGVFG